MDDRWRAEVGADPAQRARAIARAREGFLSGQPITPAASHDVREVVAQSWLRSARAKVDPQDDPPVLLADADLAAYRADHPLTAVISLLRDLVGSVAAEDGEHLMAVTDAAGRLLWVEGHATARRRAERMNFVEGAAWDEAHAGTNAPGTALALDHAVQIFAAEHFRDTVQAWTCAAAPIHDASGRVVGAIDITGGPAVAHPHSLALVRAAARAAESQLAVPRGKDPGLWTPPGREVFHLDVLGRDEATLYSDSAQFRLNRRHSELLFILALHPEGMGGEQLADALYRDRAADPVLRAELNRLRHVVGDLVLTRPYRVAGSVRSDAFDVASSLRRGDLSGAVAAYAGPLLPRSEAPAVAGHRQWLETQLRAAVFACRDPLASLRWAERFAPRDLPLWERLASVLATGPHQTAAAQRAQQLRADND